MEILLSFLRSNFYDSSTIENVDKSPLFQPKQLQRLNKIFRKVQKDENSLKTLKLIPAIEKNQIWSIKEYYNDFLGEENHAAHPFIVLINSNLRELVEGEEFIRVNVISPFVEFKANDDVVCNDPSIIGFPFLIEKWNEQPVLAEILDEYLGYYEYEFYDTRDDISQLDYKSDKTVKSFEFVGEPEQAYNEQTNHTDIVNLNKFQREFREIEVSRAKYLNNSVMSLLRFLEQQQSEDSGVIISLSGKTIFPQFYIGQKQAEPTFALAAKSGFDKEDKFIKYSNNEVPFEIFVRKNKEGFILTVTSLSNVKLFDSSNQEITGFSSKQKAVFEKLKKGLYNLKSEKIKEPIKIRLK